MICNECKSKAYIQSIINSECVVCGKEITTPHKPAYLLCKECSLRNHRCRQCGCLMEIDYSSI